MAVVVVSALALVAGIVFTLHSHRSSAASGTFGGFPSYLPKDTVTGGALHSVVDATVAKPYLATQGDTAHVILAGGSVDITAAGPKVPNEGLPLQSPASPVEWTVTMSRASGTVPVSASVFDAIDDNGHVYHPTLVDGQAALPSTLSPGQTLTFRLHSVMKTGEGLIRWLPDGKHSPVEWDFVVETD